MQSAFQKAKKLIKAKTPKSSSAKVRKQDFSQSRTYENDTDTSAQELKEFLELETKIKQQSTVNIQGSAKGLHQTTDTAGNTEKTAAGMKQPYVGMRKPEPAQNKLRDSLHERLGFKNKKDDFSKSSLEEISKSIGVGVQYKDSDKRASGAPGFRKSSFGLTDRPSPLIKSKENLSKVQHLKYEIGNRIRMAADVCLEDKMIPKALYDIYNQ